MNFFSQTSMLSKFRAKKIFPITNSYNLNLNNTVIPWSIHISMYVKVTGNPINLNKSEERMREKWRPTFWRNEEEKLFMKVFVVMQSCYVFKRLLKKFYVCSLNKNNWNVFMNFLQVNANQYNSFLQKKLSVEMNSESPESTFLGGKYSFLSHSVGNLLV